MITSINEFKIFLEKRVPRNERIEIYRDDDIIIVRPLTHNASCKYGAHTKWCVSVPSSTDMWDFIDEKKEIVLIIIQKKYVIDQEKRKRIARFLELDNEIGEGGIYGDSRKEYEKLSQLDINDLSKIIIHFRDDKSQEIFDANNLLLKHTSYEQLQIKQSAKDTITKYIKNA